MTAWQEGTQAIRLAPAAFLFSVETPGAAHRFTVLDMEFVGSRLRGLTPLLAIARRMLQGSHELLRFADNLLLIGLHPCLVSEDPSPGMRSVVVCVAWAGRKRVVFTAWMLTSSSKRTVVNNEATSSGTACSES